MRKIIILVLFFTTSCSKFIVPETHLGVQKKMHVIADKNARKDKIKRNTPLVGLYIFIGFGVYVIVTEQRVD